MSIRHMRTARIASLAAVAIVATSAPILAATEPLTTRYVVTATMARASGPQMTRDIVTVSNDGASSTTKNAAIATCFNIATGIVADAFDPQRGPALAVSFNGNSVAVPLQIRSGVLPNGFDSIAINGSVQGAFGADSPSGIAIVIAGNIVANETNLVGAQFSETSVDMYSHQPIAQAACSIARIVDLEPGAPA